MWYSTVTSTALLGREEWTIPATVSLTLLDVFILVSQTVHTINDNNNKNHHHHHHYYISNQLSPGDREDDKWKLV